MADKEEPKEEKEITVGATFNSPGPIYNLPTLTGSVKHDPRSYYARSPAYSLGARGKDGMIDSSPGPRYNPDAKVVRTGIAHVPRATITSRPKDPSLFKTPGPVMGIEAENKTSGYSFGHRGDTYNKNNSPGPGEYMLPRTFGRTVESTKRQAPSYSVKSRTKNNATEDSPGSGQYKVPEPKLYTTAPPSHSIKGRHKQMMDSTCSPGPAKHYPSNYNQKTAPKYSFGAKHSPYAVPLIVPV